MSISATYPWIELSRQQIHASFTQQRIRCISQAEGAVMAKPVKPLKTKDKTTIKGMALGGHGAMPAAVDSKDGKVVRIRPLHLDEKYDPKEFNAWKMVCLLYTSDAADD